MRSRLGTAGLALAVMSGLAWPAQAHRQWMLPSATIVSGENQWVTVDAAVSNDLFYFEHFPMRLDGLTVIAPDGVVVQAENQATGRYRSTFDVKLLQPGTYKLAVLNTGAFASYQLNGETKRWRGPAAEFATAIPAEAGNVRASEMQGRIEVFVTSGSPTDTVLQPTGVGLEMVPVTHPNNLVAGEPATFKLLLDGQPVAGLDVEVVPGGNRYRDKLNDLTIRTGQDGSFTVTWPTPGMYWLNASVQDDKASMANARRRASYVATLEVLPP